MRRCTSLKNHIMRLCLILAMITIILPVLTMVVWSFTDSFPWPDLIPHRMGLRGWRFLFRNRQRVVLSLVNSLITSFGTVIVSVVISIPCAKALALEDFKGKGLVRKIIYIPVVIPAVSLGMGMDMQFVKMGLSGTYAGLILVCVLPCIPYTVHIIEDAFSLTGDRYIEQARMLGAGVPYMVRSVMLPMIAPAMMYASIMAFIISFSQYFLVFLIGGGRIITFTMEMFPFIASGDRLLGAVYGCVFLVVTVICLLIIEIFFRTVFRKEMRKYDYI